MALCAILEHILPNRAKKNEVNKMFIVSVALENENFVSSARTLTFCGPYLKIRAVKLTNRSGHSFRKKNSHPLIIAPLANLLLRIRHPPSHSDTYCVSPALDKRKHVRSSRHTLLFCELYFRIRPAELIHPSARAEREYNVRKIITSYLSHL